jgi:hypothetical protein
MSTSVLRRAQALFVIERIDGKRFAVFAARDQVVEVAVRIGRPDLLHDHGVLRRDDDGSQ